MSCCHTNGRRWLRANLCLPVAYVQMNKPRGLPYTGSPYALPHIVRKPPGHLGIEVDDAIDCD